MLWFRGSSFQKYFVNMLNYVNFMEIWYYDEMISSDIFYYWELFSRIVFFETFNDFKSLF